MASVNTEGLTEPAGTRTCETDVLDTTALKHQVDTSPRFKGSDKNCRSWQANCVQAPVDAVRTIYIRKSSWTEHAAIALRLTLEAMRGRIIEQIGFGLHDNAACSVEK